jgi:hypothetical protein
MKIWKLEACRSDERIGCRWGYVIAETQADAIAAGRSSSNMQFIWAHKMREGMMWPGNPGQTLFWSS